MRGAFADTTETPFARLRLLQPFDFDAYVQKGYAHGAKVAQATRGLPYSELGGAMVPTDALMRIGRGSTAALPGSGTPCDSCDPTLHLLAEAAWGADTQKEQVLDRWNLLLRVLPDLPLPSDVVDTLDTIAGLVSDPALGVTNELARAELLKQIDVIRASYDPPSFPSNAVTGILPGVSRASNMALSESTFKLFIDATGGTTPPPPPTGGCEATPPEFVHVVDVRTLTPEADRQLPSGCGKALFLSAPSGRPEVYALTRRRDPRPFLSGGPTCPQVEAYIFALERLSPAGALPIDSGFLNLTSRAGLYVPLALLVTPPEGATSLLPDTAYLSFRNDSAFQPEGELYEVRGVRDFGPATVTQVPVPGPAGVAPGYVALAASPLAGVDRLYALHAGGIDGIETRAPGGPVVHENEIPLPPGLGEPTAMSSGVTATGRALLVVASADALVAIDLPSGAVQGPEPLPGAVVAVHLSLDGRFILATRHPSGSTFGSPISSVTVLDAETLVQIRDSSTAVCAAPPGNLCVSTVENPMALTIDGSHAFVSNPEGDELDYLYLRPPSLVITSKSLEGVALAVPLEDFPSGGARNQLLNLVGRVELFSELAESMPNEAARQAQLTNADGALDLLIERVDGCAGGAAGNDLIDPCEEKAGVLTVAVELQETLQGERELQLPETP